MPGVTVKNEECTINVKSILFCMDYMNSNIHEKVFEKFAKYNPYEILRKWLYSLSEY
jgi:hypothetical protein